MWSLRSTENREERDRNPSTPHYMVFVVRNGSELDCESSVRNSLAGSNPVLHPNNSPSKHCWWMYQTFNLGRWFRLPQREQIKKYGVIANSIRKWIKQYK
jgi:hypothetical protein